MYMYKVIVSSNIILGNIIYFQFSQIIAYDTTVSYSSTVAKYITQ